MVYVVCIILAFVVLATIASALLGDLAGTIVAVLGALMALFALVWRSGVPQVELANGT